MARVSTSLKWAGWKACLQGYPLDKAQFLLGVIQEGYKLVDESVVEALKPVDDATERRSEKSLRRFVSSSHRPALPQGFVKHDADAGCKIQRADIFVRHRDCQGAFPIRFEQIFGKPARFASEDKAVARLKFPSGVRLFGFGRKIKKPRIGKRGV